MAVNGKSDARGYVTDSSYVTNYFEALAPINLKFAAAVNGHKTCSLKEPFNYLELGCGNAVSLCLNAAVNPTGHFYGVDLMPEHVEFGKKICELAGIENVTLIAAGFDDLDLDAIPECDFVTAHGVISWIHDDVHDEMRGIIEKKLKQGGLLYVSYNALPGWADKAPIREIISHFNDAKKSSPDRIKQAVGVMKFLCDNKAGYFQSNQRAVKEVENIMKGNLSYLIHEYLPEGWRAFYFREINRFYKEIGMQYVGSAKLYENFNSLFLQKKFNEMLHRLKDRELRESIKDFVCNQQFRSDIYIRQEEVAQQGTLDNFDEIYLLSLDDKNKKEDKEFKMNGVNYNLKGPVYEFVKEQLAQQSKSLKELMEAVKESGLEPGNTFRYILHFVALRQAVLCVNKFDSLETNEKVRKLNTHLIDFLVNQNTIPLASEICGSAININVSKVKMLQALAESNYDTNAAFEICAKHINKNNGKSAKENRALLRENLEETQRKTVPLLKSLGIF